MENIEFYLCEWEPLVGMQCTNRQEIVGVNKAPDVTTRTSTLRISLCTSILGGSLGWCEHATPIQIIKIGTKGARYRV